MEYNKLVNYRNAQNHFAVQNGVKTLEIREGFAKCSMDIEGGHFNVINTVHGGALYTLMDSVGGATATSYGNRVTTLNSSVVYLHAVRNPGTIYGIGRTVKYGRNICVVDVQVLDDMNKCYAKGTFTFYNLGSIDDDLDSDNV